MTRPMRRPGAKKRRKDLASAMRIVPQKSGGSRPQIPASAPRPSLAISVPGCKGCARPGVGASALADILLGGSFKMREAVIVSYARTGLAKSGRGGFNMTPPMTMAAHAIKHAVERSGVETDAVEDCYLGNGAHGAGNLGRLAGSAGRPAGDHRRASRSTASARRACSPSPWPPTTSAATAPTCVVAGGVESISIPGGGMPREHRPGTDQDRTRPSTWR